MTRSAGYVVPPTTTEAIYELAAEIRRRFQRVVGPDLRFPIDLVYELLPQMLDGFELEICEAHELGEDHGQTYPDRPLIRLREDVYNGMCTGVGRDRFTAAHELGHLFMHKNIAFARRRTPDIKLYRDSEWQADSFASALLIDQAHLPRCRSVMEVMVTFGVSESAARRRFLK